MTEDPLRTQSSSSAGALVVVDGDDAPRDVALDSSITPGRRLLHAFLSGRSEHTVRGYQQDLERFRQFTGAATPVMAVEALLTSPQGKANEVVLAFRNRLLDQKFSPATVNRTVSSIRSMVKVARMIGLVPWTLEVPNVTSVTYRDTRGPGVDAVQKMLEHLRAMPDQITARRNAALIRLLFNQGLRRGEVVSLDVGHFDKGRSTLMVLGKKRREREAIQLSEAAAKALSAWLEVRPGPKNPPADAPMFISFAVSSLGHRLTGDGLLRMLKSLGEAVGVKNVRPHGLRHTAITTALDRSNGNVRAVQGFSRHKNVATIQHYDDNRQNLGKKMSDLLEK